MNRKDVFTLLIILLFFQFTVKGQIKVTYLADEYLKFYEVSKDLPDELKLQKFSSEVYENAPLIYENIYNDLKWIGQNPDDRVLTYVNEFKNIEEKFKILSESLDGQFDSSLTKFQKAFPDFKPDFDVCILHSLGIRAGGPVKVHEKTVLMFGVDQMAKYFEFQNLIPFFQHELTHIYHSVYYSPCDSDKYSQNAIYNYLWREGLAVYVSSMLNPDAKEIEIFMIDSLPQKSNEVIKIMAQDVVKNLYSPDKKLIEKYFWNSSTDTYIPRTAGYYLGYLLVKELAKEYTINELIKLDEKIFVPKFEKILNSFI